MSTTTLDLRVRGRRDVCDGVMELELVDAEGAALPPAAPGASLEVVTPRGQRRTYSLTAGPGSDPSAYRIAIALVPDGRGGSRSMHEAVQVGTVLQARVPVGAFRWSEDEDVLLLAGGIGITPLRWAHHQLTSGAHRGRVRLIHLVRTRRVAPYADEVAAGAGLLHVSAEHGRRFDLWPLLRHPGRTRVFCCGPGSLLDEVRAMTMHWRPSRLHFEDFRSPDPALVQWEAFQVVWAPSGQTVQVSGEQSLLEALQAQSLPVIGSCRAGTCGTCVLRRLDGEVDHRDERLSAAERGQLLLPCVSRGINQVTVAPV